MLTVQKWFNLSILSIWDMNACIPISESWIFSLHDSFVSIYFFLFFKITFSTIEMDANEKKTQTNWSRYICIKMKRHHVALRSQSNFLNAVDFGVNWSFSILYSLVVVLLSNLNVLFIEYTTLSKGNFPFKYEFEIKSKKKKIFLTFSIYIPYIFFSKLDITQYTIYSFTSF